MEKYITDRFIENLISLSKREFGVDEISKVKRCLIDYIGVTFAGARSKRNECNALINLYNNPGDVSIIGLGEKSHLQIAAFVNGFNSHVLELDDGHRYGMLHLEAPILSALLGVSQFKRLTFEQFIKGIIVGYESTIRLAKTIQPSHKLRGFHATGTCGSVGVACAIAAALDFTPAQWKSSISCAATSAAGLLEVIDDSSELKPYNVANAVISGINAAFMGSVGYNGPNDVLGGKRGFLRSLSDEIKEEFLKKSDLEKLEIYNIYVKPYAACRHCHSPIECALTYSKDVNSSIDEIKSIKVETYKLAVFGHDHTDIQGVSSAKMSTPYGVAAAIILGKCGLDAYSAENVNDKIILDLCKRVQVIEDPELTKVSPGKRGARVTIEHHDGQVWTKLVEYPLGEPENPISDDDLLEKYYDLMDFSGAVRAESNEIIESINNLPTDFNRFLSLI